MLRFRDLSASFSSLGASFSSFGCFVFEIWVLDASVFVFECFIFKTTQIELYEEIQRSRPLLSNFQSKTNPRLGYNMKKKGINITTYM